MIKVKRKKNHILVFFDYLENQIYIIYKIEFWKKKSLSPEEALIFILFYSATQIF